MGHKSRYATSLKVDIEKLKQGPLVIPIAHECRVFDLQDDQYTFKNPVMGELTFQYVRGNVRIRGNLEVMTRVMCIASLEEFDYLCRTDIELLFVAESKLATYGKDEDDPERHMIHTFKGDVLFPSEALRECIMVELPVYPRSPEAADRLIALYGKAGDWEGFEKAHLESESGESPSSSENSGKEKKSEDWKNRLRDLMDLPDKG